MKFPMLFAICMLVWATAAAETDAHTLLRHRLLKRNKEEGNKKKEEEEEELNKGKPPKEDKEPKEEKQPQEAPGGAAGGSQEGDEGGAGGGVPDPFVEDNKPTVCDGLKGNNRLYGLCKAFCIARECHKDLQGKYPLFSRASLD